MNIEPEARIRMPDKVVFSDAAWLDVIAETYERRETETGGILLGVRNRLTWYVLEAIDPGPKSIFQAAYFEYDREYTEHLANKIRRKYVADVVLIGLWHRHPGSFDRFSRTDDQTNNKYAQLSADGALSGLVNLDPDFRFTMYHVGNPLHYTKLPFEVGDMNIPDGVLEKRSAQYLSSGSAVNSSAITGLSNTKTQIIPWTLWDLLNPFSWFSPTNEYQETQGYADEIASIDDRLVVMLDNELQSNFLRQGRYQLTVGHYRNRIRLRLEDVDPLNQVQPSFDFAFSLQNDVESVGYEGQEFAYFAGIVGRIVETRLANGRALRGY